MPPTDSAGYIALGRQLAGKGQWEEAASAYRMALRLNPKNVEALTNLGFVYYEMGLDEEAERTLREAETLRASSEKCDSNGP